MARFLIAWEIGGGVGHLVPMLALAAAARRLGHHAVLAIPERHGSSIPSCGPASTVIPLPLAVAPPRPFPLSVNYSANLLRNGFWHAPMIQARIRQWRQVFDSVAPDVLIAEHAPSALLASRRARVRRVVVGNGFAQPPQVAPMPSLQSWLPVPASRLAAADDAWLRAVNEAIGALDEPPLTAVKDLFEGATPLLTVEPELDHYTDRAAGRFVGAMDPPASFGVSPNECSPGAADYVLVYLSAANRFLPQVLDGLSSLEWPVVAVISGDVTEHRRRYPRIMWCDAPINLSALVGRCRLAITSGGTMLASTMLKREVPLVICPEDLEKAIISTQLGRRRLATGLNWLAPPPSDLREILEHAVSDPATAAARRAFAVSHRQRTSDRIADEVITACLP